MMRVSRALTLGVIALTAGIIGVYAQMTPHVFSPEIVKVGEKEQCVKEAGKLKCRWDGPCAKVGDECHSCTRDLKYQQGLGCYSCGQGTTLKNKNGAWVCE